MLAPMFPIRIIFRRSPTTPMIPSPMRTWAPVPFSA